MRKTLGMTIAGAVLASVVAPATAQPITVNGGEVNISGATLFADFFFKPASTNDYIDADGNAHAGKFSSWPPQNLAPTWTPGTPLNTWWAYNYRGMGSGNGLKEFLGSQGCRDTDVPRDGVSDTAFMFPYAYPPADAWIPMTPATDDGYFNHAKYSVLGVPQWLGPYADNSYIPRTPAQIDLAVLDVPTKWFTAVAGLTPDWRLKPGDAGYGLCPIQSSNGKVSNLVELNWDCDGDSIGDVLFNADFANPTELTLYDTPIAWVPIAIIANRGTGIQQLTATECQHLWLSGRLPSGANLAGASRDVGSGTRNGAMNTLGIDPSWGRGDNMYSKNDNILNFYLGPDHRVTNGAGSSIMEDGVRYRQTAVGYTGLAESSRAAKDAYDGKYEVIDIVFDDRGGVSPVRPTIDTVLDNLDPNTGWQIGGPETFTSRGDPAETNPALPQYMENQAAAAYLNNITQSITNFASVPADPDNDAMPGEFLAESYFLLAGVDALPDFANDEPAVFVALSTPPFNQTLQDYIRLNNGLGWGGDTPDFGTRSVAGSIPERNANPVFGDGIDKYSDGSASGDYCDCVSGANDLVGGARLAQRNRLSADFNHDDVRDINDALGMVQAYFDPRGYESCTNHAPKQYYPGGPLATVTQAKGGQDSNSVIPEVIGDLNGDGDFSKEDLRMFADGFAMVGGVLNRKLGAIEIDEAIIATAGAIMLPWADTRVRIIEPPATPCGNPTFNTPTPVADMIVTGKGYNPGDFRGDVAGGSPVPGSAPLGWDGLINAVDIDYCCNSMGNWANVDEAIYMDLSCDMNGDLVVDAQDITELVEVILKTRPGDANLDGVVDGVDEAIILGNLGKPGPFGWADGNFDCDDDVDSDDLAIWQANAGGASVIGWASVRDHNGTEYDIVLDASATAPGSATTEPRRDGVQKIAVDFDADVSASYTAGQIVLTGGLALVSESLVNGGTRLEIEVTGSVDHGCYSIDISASVSVTGDTDCLVAAQEGDVNDDQNTNFIDVSLGKSLVGQPATVNVRADFNVDGNLNFIDVSAVKSLAGTSVVCP